MGDPFRLPHVAGAVSGPGLHMFYRCPGRCGAGPLSPLVAAGGGGPADAASGLSDRAKKPRKLGRFSGSCQDHHTDEPLVPGRPQRVFLDLKLHDIPNTVVGALNAIIDMDVDMITVHALGGFEMMESAQKVIWESKLKKPLILGVTVLTSLDEAFLQDFLGVDKSMRNQILDLAMLTKSAGLGGVVASPNEVSLIKKQCGKDFIVVTPGIGFGKCGEGYVRFALTIDKQRINKAIERLRDSLKA